MSETIDLLIYEVRVCYQSLLQVGEALHADRGISMGERAVLEYLTKYGHTTVPIIAKDRRVSRQRIQTLVNQLVEESLVKIKSNPATKRSPLIEITAKGKKVIIDMKRREEKLLQNCNISEEEAHRAMLVLRELRESLESNVI